MCDNLDDEKNEHLKKEDNKTKKKSVTTLMIMKKKERKKERKLCMIALGIMRMNKLEKMIRRKKKDKQILDERRSIFNNVQVCSMIDPCIRTTPAVRLIQEDFKGATQEGPTCICDICWKFEFE